MTRNTIGGKGHKRAKKHAISEKRNMPYKNIDEGTDYAIVKSMLGSGWAQVICLTDNQIRLGKIRGNMYKKIWIAKDDLLLVSIRDFQDNKCDILFKYNDEEKEVLVSRGQVTYSQIQGDITTNESKHEDIVFGEPDIDVDLI